MLGYETHVLQCFDIELGVQSFYVYYVKVCMKSMQHFFILFRNKI